MIRSIIKRIDNDRDCDLHDAVMELPFIERGYVNPTKFGRYLGRNKNRIVNGLQLVEAEHSERRAWAVVPIAPRAEAKLPPAPIDPLEGIERVWLEDMLAKGTPLPTLP